MIVTYVAAAGLKAIDKSDIDTDGFISRLSHAALNAYGYSIVLTYLAIENALQRGHDQLALSHFSAIYIAKTGFTADRNPFKADDWYKIDCSKIFEKPEELPLEPRPVANGGAKVTAIALGLTLPLMEGEPTTYFASRLAARNFLKARPFAADMGYTALDRGCEIAISRLSEISGVSVAALAANASHRVDEWLHLRGQIIAPRSRRAKPISLESAIVRWFVGSGGPAAMNPACMVRPVIPKPRAAPGGLMSLATFGANFTLAASLMSSAWAQSATVERSAKGAAATDIQVGLYLNVKPDCTSGTCPPYACSLRPPMER